MQQQRHDVLIIGGGLVGASLAIALDRVGADVGLVEATASDALPAVFDQRNLSFAEATVNALAALGVLQKLRTPGAPIRRIHVSRAGDFGRVVLEARDHGRTAFGQVVVARELGAALEARLEEARGVTRYRPARCLGLGSVDAGSRAIRITGVEGDGEGERMLAARLVVAADGTRSGLRDALGIGVDEHDYGQTLLVARIRAERVPDGTAWERFGDHGPTALLPRGDGHYGVIHGVAAAEADTAMHDDDSAWLARLQHALGWRVGRLLDSGPRSAYPALRLVARGLTAERALLVGNAAQTLHPVGAQGFNLGLRDALTLAELIGAGMAADPEFDCGTPALLAAHARRREEDRRRTLAFSDGLARLTASDASLLRPLRSAAMLGMDRLPALQAWLVGGAMGYRGDVPALCRAPVNDGASA